MEAEAGDRRRDCALVTALPRGMETAPTPPGTPPAAPAASVATAEQTMPSVLEKVAGRAHSSTFRLTVTFMWDTLGGVLESSS